MKKLRLVNKIKDFFADSLKQDVIENYKLSISDLRLLLVMADKMVFNGSLPILDAKIKILKPSEVDDHNWKAGFIVVKNKYGDPDINIMMVANQEDLAGEFFPLVVTSLYHEEIHFYDWIAGELKSKYEKYGRTSLTKIENNRQYIDDYDLHSQFFIKQTEKFKEQGVFVTEFYRAKDRKTKYLMDNEKKFESPKWLEKAIFGKTLDDLDESSNLNPEELEKKKKDFEKFVDSLKCKNKAAKFINDDLWYFAHFD